MSDFKYKQQEAIKRASEKIAKVDGVDIANQLDNTSLDIATSLYQSSLDDLESKRYLFELNKAQQDLINEQNERIASIRRIKALSNPKDSFGISEALASSRNLQQIKEYDQLKYEHQQNEFERAKQKIYSDILDTSEQQKEDILKEYIAQKTLVNANENVNKFGIEGLQYNLGEKIDDSYSSLLKKGTLQYANDTLSGLASIPASIADSLTYMFNEDSGDYGSATREAFKQANEHNLNFGQKFTRGLHDAIVSPLQESLNDMNNVRSKLGFNHLVDNYDDLSSGQMFDIVAKGAVENAPEIIGTAILASLTGGGTSLANNAGRIATAMNRVTSNKLVNKTAKALLGSEVIGETSQPVREGLRNKFVKELQAQGFSEEYANHIASRYNHNLDAYQAKYVPELLTGYALAKLDQVFDVKTLLQGRTFSQIFEPVVRDSIRHNTSLGDIAKKVAKVGLEIGIPSLGESFTEMVQGSIQELVEKDKYFFNTLQNHPLGAQRYVQDLIENMKAEDALAGGLTHATLGTASNTTKRGLELGRDIKNNREADKSARDLGLKEEKSDSILDRLRKKNTDNTNTTSRNFSDVYNDAIKSKEAYKEYVSNLTNLTKGRARYDVSSSTLDKADKDFQLIKKIESNSMNYDELLEYASENNIDKERVDGLLKVSNNEDLITQFFEAEISGGGYEEPLDEAIKIYSENKKNDKPLSKETKEVYKYKLLKDLKEPLDLTIDLPTGIPEDLKDIIEANTNQLRKKLVTDENNIEQLISYYKKAKEIEDKLKTKGTSLSLQDINNTFELDENQRVFTSEEEEKQYIKTRASEVRDKKSFNELKEEDINYDRTSMNKVKSALRHTMKTSTDLNTRVTELRKLRYFNDLVNRYLQKAKGETFDESINTFDKEVVEFIKENGMLNELIQAVKEIASTTPIETNRKGNAPVKETSELTTEAIKGLEELLTDVLGKREHAKVLSLALQAQRRSNSIDGLGVNVQTQGNLAKAISEIVAIQAKIDKAITSEEKNKLRARFDRILQSLLLDQEIKKNKRKGQKDIAKYLTNQDTLYYKQNLDNGRIQILPKDHELAQPDNNTGREKYNRENANKFAVFYVTGSNRYEHVFTDLLDSEIEQIEDVLGVVKSLIKESFSQIGNKSKEEFTKQVFSKERIVNGKVWTLDDVRNNHDKYSADEIIEVTSQVNAELQKATAKQKELNSEESLASLDEINQVTNDIKDLNNELAIILDTVLNSKNWSDKAKNEIKKLDKMLTFLAIQGTNRRIQSASRFVYNKIQKLKRENADEDLINSYSALLARYTKLKEDRARMLDETNTKLPRKDRARLKQLFPEGVDLVFKFADSNFNSYNPITQTLHQNAIIKGNWFNSLSNKFNLGIDEVKLNTLIEDSKYQALRTPIMKIIKEQLANEKLIKETKISDRFKEYSDLFDENGQLSEYVIEAIALARIVSIDRLNFQGVVKDNQKNVIEAELENSDIFTSRVVIELLGGRYNQSLGGDKDQAINALSNLIKDVLKDSSFVQMDGEHRIKLSKEFQDIANLLKKYGIDGKPEKEFMTRTQGLIATQSNINSNNPFSSTTIDFQRITSQQKNALMPRSYAHITNDLVNGRSQDEIIKEIKDSTINFISQAIRIGKERDLIAKIGENYSSQIMFDKDDNSVRNFLNSIRFNSSFISEDGTNEVYESIKQLIDTIPSIDTDTNSLINRDTIKAKTSAFMKKLTDIIDLGHSQIIATNNGGEYFVASKVTPNSRINQSSSKLGSQANKDIRFAINRNLDGKELYTSDTNVIADVLLNYLADEEKPKHKHSDWVKERQKILESDSYSKIKSIVKSNKSIYDKALDIQEIIYSNEKHNVTSNSSIGRAIALAQSLSYQDGKLSVNLYQLPLEVDMATAGYAEKHILSLIQDQSFVASLYSQIIKDGGEKKDRTEDNYTQTGMRNVTYLLGFNNRYETLSSLSKEHITTSNVNKVISKAIETAVMSNDSIKGIEGKKATAEVLKLIFKKSIESLDNQKIEELNTLSIDQFLNKYAVKHIRDFGKIPLTQATYGSGEVNNIKTSLFKNDYVVSETLKNQLVLQTFLDSKYLNDKVGVNLFDFAIHHLNTQGVEGLEKSLNSYIEQNFSTIKDSSIDPMTALFDLAFPNKNFGVQFKNDFLNALTFMVNVHNISKLKDIQEIYTTKDKEGNVSKHSQHIDKVANQLKIPFQLALRDKLGNDKISKATIAMMTTHAYNIMKYAVDKMLENEVNPMLTPSEQTSDDFISYKVTPHNTIELKMNLTAFDPQIFKKYMEEYASKNSTIYDEYALQHYYQLLTTANRFGYIRTMDDNKELSSYNPIETVAGITRRKNNIIIDYGSLALPSEGHQEDSESASFISATSENVYDAVIDSAINLFKSTYERNLSKKERITSEDLQPKIMMLKMLKWSLNNSDSKFRDLTISTFYSSQLENDNFDLPHFNQQLDYMIKELELVTKNLNNLYEEKFSTMTISQAIDKYFNAFPMPIDLGFGSSNFREDNQDVNREELNRFVSFMGSIWAKSAIDEIQHIFPSIGANKVKGGDLSSFKNSVKQIHQLLSTISSSDMSIDEEFLPFVEEFNKVFKLNTFLETHPSINDIKNILDKLVQDLDSMETLESFYKEQKFPQLNTLEIANFNYKGSRNIGSMNMYILSQAIRSMKQIIEPNSGSRVQTNIPFLNTSDNLVQVVANNLSYMLENKFKSVQDNSNRYGSSIHIPKSSAWLLGTAKAIVDKYGIENLPINLISNSSIPSGVSLKDNGISIPQGIKVEGKEKIIQNLEAIQYTPSIDYKKELDNFYKSLGIDTTLPLDKELFTTAFKLGDWKSNNKDINEGEKSSAKTFLKEVNSDSFGALVTQIMTPIYDKYSPSELVTILREEYSNNSFVKILRQLDPELNKVFLGDIENVNLLQFESHILRAKSSIYNYKLRSTSPITFDNKGIEYETNVELPLRDVLRNSPNRYKDISNDSYLETKVLTPEELKDYAQEVINSDKFISPKEKDFLTNRLSTLLKYAQQATTIELRQSRNYSKGEINTQTGKIIFSRGSNLNPSNMSDSQILVHELSHLLTSYAEKDNRPDVIHTWTELTKMHQRFKKELERPSTQEKLMKALDVTKEVFETNYKEYMTNDIHEFIAIASSNQDVAEVLRSIKESNNETFLDKLSRFVNKLLDLVFNRQYVEYSNENDLHRFNTLIEKLTFLKENTDQRITKTRAEELIGKVLSTVTEPLNKVGKVLGSIGNQKTKEFITSLEKSNMNPKVKASIATVTTLGLLLRGGKHNQPYLDKINDMLEKGFGKGSEIQSLVSTALNTKSKTEFLNKFLGLSSDIDKNRNYIEGATKAMMKSFFKSPITKEQDRALLNIVQKSDLASLDLEGKELSKLLLDDGKIEAGITSQLEVITNMNIPQAKKEELLRRVDTLATYLATGEIKGYMLTNAVNIVNDSGLRFTGNIDDKHLITLITAIDKLVTYKALEQQDLSEIKTLIANDREGFENFVNYTRNISNKSKEMFKYVNTNNKTYVGVSNYVKGHITTSISDSNVAIKVAPVSKEQEMKQLGFKLVSKLSKNYSDVDGVVGLYASTNEYHVAYNRGAMRLGGYNKQGYSIGSLIKAKFPDKDQEFLVNMTKSMSHKILEDLKKDKDWKENSFVPVFNMNGEIKDLQIIMSSKQKEALGIKTPSVFDSFAGEAVKGLDHSLSINHNNRLIDAMNTFYQNNKGSYISINMKTGLLDRTNMNEDQVKAIDDFISMLPSETKEYILEQHGGKLHIPSDVFYSITGFNDYRVLTDDNHPEISNVSRRILKMVEAITHKSGKVWKEKIVLKTPDVIQGNIKSNISMMMMQGYSPTQIAKALHRAYILSKDYSTHKNEVYKLRAEINSSTGTRKVNLERKLSKLEERYRDTSVKALDDFGLMTDIVEDTTFQSEQHGDIFDAKYKEFKEKYVNGDLSKKALDNLFITENTTLWKLANDLVGKSDSLFRIALFELNKEKGFKDQTNLLQVQDMFINYNYLDGPKVKYANDTMLFGFTKYMVGIQKLVAGEMLTKKLGFTLLAKALQIFTPFSLETPLKYFMPFRVFNPSSFLNVPFVDSVNSFSKDTIALDNFIPYVDQI